MTTPRPPLRLVDKSDHASGEPDFERVDRAPHDLHVAYHELGDGEQPGTASGFDEDAEAEPDALRPASSARFIVVALIAFQLLAVLAQADKYATLARGGEAYGLAAVLSAPASLCLYVGAGMLAWRPGRGRALFFIATVGLGLSLPAWGISAGWSWPIAFGAMLGLAGAWVARAAPVPDPDAEAQP